MANPLECAKPSKPAKNSGYTKPSRKTRIRRFYKKLPRPLQIIIGSFAVLVYLGMPWLTVEIGVFVLVAMLEFPWVASAILIGMFLIALLPSNGWTEFGTYLFLTGVVVSAFFDIRDILTFLYRLVLYSIIYGVLITLRGFFPKMKTDSDSESKGKGKRKRKQRKRKNGALPQST